MGKNPAVTRLSVRGSALVLPRAVLTFFGLSAVIAGILAMHVWTGGHGHAGHTTAGGPAATVTASLTGSPGVGSGEHHLDGPSSAHAHASVGLLSETAPVMDCGSPCDAGDVMTGMCELALIVINVLGLLVLRGTNLPGTVQRRGPPALSKISLPARAPSLTQLCISRT
ncbi:hypothetical protein D6T65_15865 [Arthrobacter frigidicola]|nr:hypothetical protein D6T65_15865 [Arthrobacter frigidicola]